ncbi:hypothetical protein P8452_43640 [Trifolium repens]|nr:hypothetical protein P8452_43640 [Trifolium repens]
MAWTKNLRGFTLKKFMHKKNFGAQLTVILLYFKIMIKRNRLRKHKSKQLNFKFNKEQDREKQIPHQKKKRFMFFRHEDSSGSLR